MSRSRRQPWKLLVPTAAAAVLFTLVPLAGVADAATTPPAQDTSTFCQNVPPDNPFTDVGAGPHHDNILCLSAAGITTGTTATTYSPANVVTRAQMASFVARSIDEANSLETPGTNLTDLPPFDGTNNFSDVPDNNVHKANINRLADAGIVNGKAPGIYDPSGPVTRAQMASFINRAEDFLTGTPFTSTTDFFTDDDGNVHEDNINGIASVGIAQGKTPGIYAPDDGVTREQMASFLIRWLAVEEAAGDITPLPGGAPDLVTAAATDTDQNGALSTGDSIVLNFADAIAVTSSLTLTDADGTVVTLTDTSPTPAGSTAATFTLSNSNKTLTVTVTGPVVATGGTGGLNGAVTITDASGITDASSGEAWNPDNDGSADVQFTFPAAQGQTGTVTFVDTATDTYRFVPNGGNAEVTVTYKAGDTFKDDGTTATFAKFETDLSVGDTIHFIDDTTATNKDTHELTNHTPASITSGTVGNVDTAANTFFIIDPVSGAVLSDSKAYDAQLYLVDGVSATQAAFEAAINEGDTVVITAPVAPATATTFALTNKSVSGTVTSVAHVAHTVAIGNLGDDPTGPQDIRYDYSLAGSTYTIGGTTATLAEFDTALTTGDMLTYARTAGVQTFALTNTAPASQSGTVTETHSPGATTTDGGTVTIVNGATRTPIVYAAEPTQHFTVNGANATESDFEAAITAGDTVVFQAGDPATSTVQTIALTNSTPDKSVTGVMKDVQVGANTYDVVNAAGGVIYDNLQYVAPPPADFGGFAPRYFVKAPNGTESEVTLVQWEGYLNKIAAAPTAIANITVLGTATAVEHHLTTDQTLP
jgi:hypothetical protein